MDADEAEARLRALADEKAAAGAHRFFKTGPGEYGEGDVFIGVKAAPLRKFARECHALPLAEAERLLHSGVHEVRMLGLLVLVRAFEKGDGPTREAIYNLYLSNTSRVNNWDLVDVSAPGIVGGHLFERSRAPLTRLAKSKSLWVRRIAIVATQHFIRRGDLAETWRLATMLLGDREDLIHKAAGWMLREAGDRDGAALEGFLAEHTGRMPRTMLRYAIEKLPEARRQHHLGVSRRPRPRP